MNVPEGVMEGFGVCRRMDGGVRLGATPHCMEVCPGEK